MQTSSCKINSWKLYKATSKLNNPISDSTHRLEEISFLVLRLRLENGIIGESYLLSFQYSPQAIRGAFKDILPMIKGINAYETGIVKNLITSQSEYFGHPGINRWVESAINIAMWDAWAKTLAVPVWKFWGTYREKVMIYGSGGWISYSIKELLDEVVSYVARGFKAIKIKVGSPDWRADLERLRMVRKEAGDSIEIMMDANQGMELSSAIELVRGASHLNIYWFEEPLHHDNLDGYKTLKQQTGISLAMGEREYDCSRFKSLLKKRAVDIWQPDLLRIGGVESWRESALIANSYNIPVLPHYYREYDLPLVCTIPNGKGVESFDWIDSLIDMPVKVTEGYAHLSHQPGWGFNFLDAALAEIK